MKADSGHRQSNKRLRPITRHSMATLRNRTVDTRQPDGQMVLFPSPSLLSGTFLITNRGSIKRRHVAVKATAVDTLQNQFSGYGSTSAVVARVLDKLALKEPLQDWSDETIERVVNAFTDEKFPTVIALNKIDHPDADKNISKIAKSQDPNSIVLTSAISEVFLRKLTKQGFIRYTEGADYLDTREDLIEAGDPDGGGLKELDEKLRTRIENLKDMVCSVC